MSELPRRRLFQVHLSTAIVMMLAVGLLMWANMREWNSIPPDLKHPILCDTLYGWPSIMLTRESGLTLWGRPNISAYSIHLDYASVTLDLAVALLILFVVWFACERLFRSSAANKEV